MSRARRMYPVGRIDLGLQIHPQQQVGEVLNTSSKRPHIRGFPFLGATRLSYHKFLKIQLSRRRVDWKLKTEELVDAIRFPFHASLLSWTGSMKGA